MAEEDRLTLIADFLAHSHTMVSEDDEGHADTAMKAKKPMKAKEVDEVDKTKKAMKKAMKVREVMTDYGVQCSIARKCSTPTFKCKVNLVKDILHTYMDLVAEEVKKNGSYKIGSFCRISFRKKAATPAREGVNPFTKEIQKFKAKPAKQQVLIFPLKRLKDRVME